MEGTDWPRLGNSLITEPRGQSCLQIQPCPLPWGEGVLKPAPTGSLHCVQGPHVVKWKLAMGGVFTPWKSASNTIHSSPKRNGSSMFSSPPLPLKERLLKWPEFSNFPVFILCSGPLKKLWCSWVIQFLSPILLLLTLPPPRLFVRGTNR